MLRVKFTDSEKWEEIGPIEQPVIVAAYATELPELLINRRVSDQSRKVAEIEISVTDYVLPARFYDLPGVNTPNQVHDAIVRERMQDADYLVYVTKATSTLSDPDLELIRSLYTHHKTTGKRILWVLTATDQAADLSWDNKPKWEATLERNNSYLREFFPTDDGRPDADFIGKGFVAVSPALEAQAGFEYAENREKAAELQAESRMEELRRSLMQIVESGTGRKHAASVAFEAHVMVQRHRSALMGTLATERIPVDEIRTELNSIQRQMASLSSRSHELINRLEERLKDRIKTALRSFNEEEFSSHLHGALDELIRSSDLRKEKAINRMEVRKTQEVREWVSASGGLLESWTKQSEAFKADVVSMLRELLRDDSSFWKSPTENEALNVDRLSLSKFDPSTSEAEDLVQKATGLAGTIVPLVGTVTAAIGATTTAVALLPVGAAVAIAGLYTLARHRDRVESSLDVMRKEEIRNLGTVAVETKQWFVLNASVAGEALIESARGIIEDHQRQLDQNSRRLEQRMSEPEELERQEFVELLDSICAEGSNVLTGLSEYRWEDRHH
jgi:hypothetical protein